MSRVKLVVLTQFGAYWLVVLVLLIAARSVFDEVLGQQVAVSGDRRPAEIATVLVLTALLSLISFGVVRGWRWMFWLLLVVFFAGMLRVPVAVLELAGRLTTPAPGWYVVLTAFVGLAQFCTAVAMLIGFRRAGIWADP